MRADIAAEFASFKDTQWDRQCMLWWVNEVNRADNRRGFLCKHLGCYSSVRGKGHSYCETHRITETKGKRGRPKQSVCKRGHALTGANRATNGKAGWRCRACVNVRASGKVSVETGNNV